MRRCGRFLLEKEDGQYGALVGIHGRERAGREGKCRGGDTCEDILECKLDIAGV